MKKSAARAKPARKAAKKKRAGPLERFLSSEDLDLLRRMLIGAEPDDDRSVEDMVESFLSVDPTGVEDMPDPDAMSELAEELDRLRVDANGGDPEAREALRTVRERIDGAAGRDQIHPGILMLLGRLFAGAHVDIGEAARASMGRMAQAGLFHEPGGDGYRTLVQPLLNDLGGDDYALHEEVRSVFAIFPVDYRSRLIETFAADSGERSRRSAVGFLLDSDDAIALAAIRGLAAAREGVDETTRRRLDLIRPCLSATRREALDRVFPPGAAADRPAAAIVRAIATACDGSGAASLTATVKRGARFNVVALMLKATGVADAHIIENASKAEASNIERSVGGSIASADVPRETWLRLVRLALGRNLAGVAPPPFEFVRAVETIALGPLEPDVSTPAEIIESLLAPIADRDDPTVIAAAQTEAVDLKAVDNWFEAGEAVERVLRPTRTIAKGAEALLETYLPRRRAFWASQCALTALALSAGAPPEVSRDLALVGRELLRDGPLSDIPLIREIAERSARTFFTYRK